MLALKAGFLGMGQRGRVKMITTRKVHTVSDGGGVM
jgi:hypothetical protein